MMYPVTAALKRYNMNSSGKYVGDCFKRALALAFKKDYDVVKNELNKMVRDGQAWKNNSQDTLIKYIKAHGGTEILSNGKDPLDTSVETIDDFCEEHPQGTYLLFSNKDKNAHWSNHIVCVIDGDVYDSWDSTDSKVFKKFKVSDESRQLYFDNVSDMRVPVIEMILPELEKYLVKLFDKYTAAPDSPISDIELETFKPYTKDSLVCTVKCYLVKDRISKHSDSFGYSSRVHCVTLKLDINLDAEENAKRLWPKLKQKLYDWMYNIVDDIKLSNKLALTQTWKYYGDKTIIRAMPDELWPYFYEATKLGAWSDSNYLITIKHPDDGRPLDFYADTVSEMRGKLKRFLEYREED